MANENLKTALQSAGLQPDDLAEQIDVDVKTVRRWLYGALPYPRHRIRIAHALHTTERFRRRDFGHMDMEITIDDPKAYTQPWVARNKLPLRLMPPNTDLMEMIPSATEAAEYKKVFAAAGAHPDDFRHLDDLARFPFTTKQDLRANYPFGLFAVPRERLARIHASSGTTGKPTVVGYTRGDLDVWASVVAPAGFPSVILSPPPPLEEAGGTTYRATQVYHGYQPL